MCQAAAAGVGHLKAANRTLVTGDLDDLDHVRILLVAAHRNLNAFGKDRTLLVNTAAHGRRLTRDNDLRNVQKIVKQGVLPRLSCNLAQNFVFQMLYFCIEFSHAFIPQK